MLYTTLDYVRSNFVIVQSASTVTTKCSLASTNVILWIIKICFTSFFLFLFAEPGLLWEIHVEGVNQTAALKIAAHKEQGLQLMITFITD